MGHGDGSSAPELEERLGRIAVQRAFITPQQLQTALDHKEREGFSLRDALLDLHFVTPPQILRLEAEAASSPAYAPVGRFALTRELGRGTSAVVYDAVDASCGKRVALKVFHPGPAADADRFLREGALASKLPSHPGIVPVLETGEADGRRYLAMELVEGLHLDDWIRQGSVTFPMYVEILRDAAVAVDHAHRFGIIHRDLKPENILIDAARHARVTDFGLAKTVSAPSTVSLTATGVAVGTPAYMSPEQIRGSKDVDRRCDVWSLGVMLYEGLTGRRPFDGETAFEAMTKAVSEDPPPPSKCSRLQMNPELFRTVELVTLKALAKDPRDRYPDAAAFAHDLTRWLAGERFEIRTPAPSSTLRRPRRWTAPAIAAAAGALLASAVLLWPKSEQALPAIPSPPPTARGAILEYCGGLSFNTLGKREVDARRRFDDPADPIWPGGPEYYVSLRWTGRLRVPRTDTYVFSVRAPETARLSVARVDVVSNAVPNSPTDASGRARLEAGLHELVLEVAHSGAPAEVVVLWGPERGTAAPLGPGELVHDPAAVRPVFPPAVNGPMHVPDAQEGEMLEVVETSGRDTKVQEYHPFRAFWNGRWSGASHLWWGGGAKRGDVFTVRFRSPSAGRRKLALAMTRGMDHGVFRVLVNGRTVLDALDLYAADLATGEIEVPAVDLRAGPNELSFQVLGANPAARGWGPGGGIHQLGVDYVRLK